MEETFVSNEIMLSILSISEKQWKKIRNYKESPVARGCAGYRLYDVLRFKIHLTHEYSYRMIVRDLEEERLKINDKIGIIYFVGHESHKYVKIGFTSNRKTLKKRLKKIQTYCPFDVELIGILENKSMLDERRLHERFKDQRLRGEWFEQDRYMPFCEMTRFINEYVSK